MSHIMVVLKTYDASLRISLPTDTVAKELINKLILKYKLPTQQQDGRQIVYRIHHERSNTTLSDDESLSDVGVVNNDIFLILMEQRNGYIPKTSEYDDDGMDVLDKIVLFCCLALGACAGGLIGWFLFEHYLYLFLGALIGTGIAFILWIWAIS